MILTNSFVQGLYSVNAHILVWDFSPNLFCSLINHWVVSANPLLVVTFFSCRFLFHANQMTHKAMQKSQHCLDVILLNTQVSHFYISACCPVVTHNRFKLVHVSTDIGQKQKKCKISSTPDPHLGHTSRPSSLLNSMLQRVGKKPHEILHIIIFCFALRSRFQRRL